jgi:hypothetical protein
MIIRNLFVGIFDGSIKRPRSNAVGLVVGKMLAPGHIDQCAVIGTCDTGERCYLGSGRRLALINMSIKARYGALALPEPPVAHRPTIGF